MQVTLEWTGDADLDLHVIDPDGFEIYFGAPTSPSGGSLDTDKIPDCDDGGPHFENVFWPEGGAPSGQYEAFVSNLGACSSGPAVFDMTILVGGAPAGDDGERWATAATAIECRSASESTEPPPGAPATYLSRASRPHAAR